MEIAHGIDVYYENNKDFQNVVFFGDGTYRYYPTGGMLAEISSNEAMYLITDKVQNMIKLYPDADADLSQENISVMFQWLYATIEDEDLPVATELFRSSFSDSIFDTLNQLEVAFYKSVSELFSAVYKKYEQSVQAFCVFFVALAAVASKTADSFQEEMAGIFWDYAKDLYKSYTNKCNVRQLKDKKRVETTPIRGFIQLLIFEYCRMKKENIVIKICANCGRFFSPEKRTKTIYCSAPSPQNPKKSCKEIGARIKRDEQRRTDPYKREQNATMAKYGMALKRARDNENKTLEIKIENELLREKAKYQNEGGEP